MIDFNNYTELAKHYEESLDIVAKITAGSVENLSYRLYRQDAEPTDVIIVYHGGGVNRDAGYDILARQLSTFQELAICLVDIRGHGCSAGERGTVAQPERIWRDVDVIMAEMHRYFPQARRHLFGHSSGAGMLLNYFTRYPFEQQADSLIMLAPELGPFSGTARDAASRFAQVCQWPFIVNALSGGRLCGQYRAVSLNFPSEVLEIAPSFVRQYSVNMANALTPRNPGKQLAALPVRRYCWLRRRMSYLVLRRYVTLSRNMVLTGLSFAALRIVRTWYACLKPTVISTSMWSACGRGRDGAANVGVAKLVSQQKKNAGFCYEPGAGIAV
ncbi:alpha/beta hydrolase [Pectobacterium brasiliense]|uniref:alpha/beta hydrolase n=1 Tax=Pectobacterium brasiliense TaxID=180957 RepID=UPI000AE3C2AD|nr:alpha/beta fold hydrolase [Pectobacterium brasiliense]